VVSKQTKNSLGKWFLLFLASKKTHLKVFVVGAGFKKKTNKKQPATTVFAVPGIKRQ
jgi:hypothetical protein